MHELGIAESALKAALQEMELRNGKRILSIGLRIGDLAGVDPEAMRFAMDTVIRNTPAGRAIITIEHVPPVAWCRHCSEEFHTNSIAFFQCPHCGEYSGDLRRGREIELARLELDS